MLLSCAEVLEEGHTLSAPADVEENHHFNQDLSVCHVLRSRDGLDEKRCVTPLSSLSSLRNLGATVAAHNLCPL